VRPASADRLVSVKKSKRFRPAGADKRMGESTISTSVEDLTFEQALDQLDQLVRRMESGVLALDESIAAYRRGAELARFCQGRLADAERQIQMLDGDVLKDFTPAESPDTAT
jgi:exodeoxyribonuclease VII small subunit